MSVSDEEAKRNMADATSTSSTPSSTSSWTTRARARPAAPVHVSQLIEKEAASFRDPTQIRITSRVAADAKVLADEVELGRVF